MQHNIEQVAETGPWGGPTLRYRGARIECYKGSHVTGFFLDGHPFSGHAFGVVGTVLPYIDLWLDEQRPPAHVRAVPKG